MGMVATVALAGSPPTVTSLTPTGLPGVRRDCGGVLRTRGTESMIFYGGFNGATLSDLVSFSPGSNGWATLPSSFPARERHSMGWDPNADRTAIVGGINGLSVFDTISFVEGTTAGITPTLPATRPSARGDASLVWVPSLNKFIYYGGRTSVFANNHVGDMWMLDIADGGVKWDVVSQGLSVPSARGATCLTWNPLDDTLLLFGGEAMNNTNDTWSFALDGGGWTNLTVSGTVPSARSFSACAWEPNIKEYVLYGGQTTNPINGLFSFNPATKTWTQHTPVVDIGNLSDATALYSPTLGGIVIFGGRTAGTTYTNAMWLVKFGAMTLNQPPVADAGPNFSIAENALATLSGSATDLEGDPLTFAWVQSSGPGVTLSNAAVLTPSFTTPRVTASTPLTFTLSVSEDGGSASSSVVVTVLNTIDEAPSADAGPDQTVNAGALVSLSGSGSDPNNDALTYGWTQLSGINVTLSSTASATPTFTAPPQAATLVLQLIANDGTLASSPDTVTITVLAPDAGMIDAGVTDAGTTDAGGADAGVPDAGAPDAGLVDGGALDAGLLPDGGAEPTDAGAPEVDAGFAGPRAYATGCACRSGSDGGLLLLGLLALARRRRASAQRER